MEEGTPLEVDLTTREGTRWEQRPQRQSAPRGGERSGNYLALGIGLLLPALIVFTAVRAARAESWAALLPQRIELQLPIKTHNRLHGLSPTPRARVRRPSTAGPRRRKDGRGRLP